MKKTIKIVSIVLLSLLVLLITLPFLFKGTIDKKAKEEVNKMLNAKVDWKSIDLSLIRNFPNLSVGLDGLKVVGVKEFEGDTLVAFKSFKLSVNLGSVLFGDQIEIKSILLDEPKIYATVLKTGKANWDIAKASDTTKTTEPKDTSTTKFKLTLKKFEIRKANIVYQDEKMNVFAAIKNLGYVLKGDFTQDNTDIDNKLTIEKMSVLYGGIKYLNNAAFEFAAKISADLKNMKFTFKDNELALNALHLGFDGTVSMVKEDIGMDLKFYAKKTDFKEVLSLVPMVYMKSFKDVKTAGHFALKGFAKGTYNKTSLPGFGADLIVENAMFKYPSLPKSVDNINIKVNVDNKGGKGDVTDVDVSKFHVELAQNPFDAQVHVTTSAADVLIKGKLVGKIELEKLKDVIPLDSMTVAGLVNANIVIAGNLSSIEKQKYEDFKADGKVELTNIRYTSKDLPQGVLISKGLLNFTPKYLDLAAFDAQIGKSDIHLIGKVLNFIPYALKKETLSASLNFSSNLLDANEFLTGKPTTPETTKKDTLPLEAFEIPKNIDFHLITKLKKVYYDKLTIDNIDGLIDLKDAKASLTNLKMNLLQGSLSMNGFYDAAIYTSPNVDLKLDMTDIDIADAAKAFNTVKKMAPIAERCKGKFSMVFNYASELTKNMMPVLNTVNGGGAFKSNNIGISDAKIFGTMADLLKNETFRKPTLKDVNVNFSIVNGNVTIKPFNTSIGNYKAEIGGTQGLDQVMNYKILSTIPKSDLGAAGALLSKATSALGVQGNEDLLVDLRIEGKINAPKIRINKIDFAKGSAKEVIKEKVQEVVTKQVDQIKQQAEEKAKAEAEKLKKEAQEKAKKEVENLKNKAAERLKNMF